MRTETFFAPFRREKKLRPIAQLSRTSDYDSSVSRKQLRPPRRIEQMSFSVVCSTNFTVRRSYITTKICTTCTYYGEILSLLAPRSGRIKENCVLLNLRTIEKRKDWIWIGFQSLRVIECTYYREMTVLACLFGHIWKVNHHEILPRSLSDRVKIVPLKNWHVYVQTSLTLIEACPS